jgi:transposase-like protein
MARPYPTVESKRELVQALEAADWVLARAARALGISRQTLYATMELYGVKRRRQPSPSFFRERARVAGLAPKRSKRTEA